MEAIRNVAIIAHVDHGKTTLVDNILKQVQLFRDNEEMRDCFLDSNDLERERGITILSKNISIRYRDTKVNLIDTPGHSDFGGQVERVLNMADGALLLVDSAEGPMPQTRFVLQKALDLGLRVIVIINKMDKPDSRPDTITDKVFDLFVELEATDEQLDFPIIYASGRDGWTAREPEGTGTSFMPLMDALIDELPGPPRNGGPVQMQVTTLDHSDYVGRVGIGRVHRGTLQHTAKLVVIKRDGAIVPAKIKQIQVFDGLDRSDVDEVPCGDLCAVIGIEDIDIGDTIADAEHAEALPPIVLDEPTISMIFRVNDSPLYGQDGNFLSSSHIRKRLFAEAERDVALHVGETAGEDFEVSGRGVLHLSILLENMRREGYEVSVSRPRVIYRDNNGNREEPIEQLTVDVPDGSAGKVIELAGTRKGEMIGMESTGNRVCIDFLIPTRGMIGLRSRVMTATGGEGIVTHRFMHYAADKGEMPSRTNGVLVSMDKGQATAYAIDALQQRGSFFIEPNDESYEGMIVGENRKEGDLVVNIQRGKQLSNVRASGTDKAAKIAPAKKLNLEESLEFIDDDELVEVTPNNIRLRKRLLTENERKRQPKSSKPWPSTSS
jgi:GTP-binding protein